MSSRNQFAFGLILLVAGVTVIAIGGAFPSSDPLVALGWFEVVPLLLSFGGSVFVLVVLARRPEGVGRSAIYKILGLCALAGLSSGLGYGAAGILSQIPDTVAGLNGPFVPGSAPALGVFFLIAAGLLAGLTLGGAAAVVWRMSHARDLPPEITPSR